MDRDDLIAKIKNGQRWKNLDKKIKIQLSPIQDPGEFVKKARSLRISKPLELYQSREDNLLYGNAPIPPEPEQPSEPAQGGGRFPLHGFPHKQEPQKQYTLEEIDKQAKAYAEEQAIEWNKAKDPTKALSYFHAYGQAEDNYWYNFAVNNPKTFRVWARDRTHPLLARTLKRLDDYENAVKRGVTPPDISWQKGKVAGKGFGFSEKSRLQTLRVGKGLQTKKKAYQRLYEQSPSEFSESVFARNKSKFTPSGKTIGDPTLRKVLREGNITKTSSAIKRSVARHAAKTSDRKRFEQNYPLSQEAVVSQTIAPQVISQEAPEPEVPPQTPSGRENKRLSTPGISGLRTAVKATRWACSPGKIVLASIFGIMLSTFIFVTVFAATEGGIIAPVDVPPEEEVPPPPPIDEPQPICDSSIPGLSYCIDAPSHVRNGETYSYKVTGTYTVSGGGKPLEDLVLTLIIPGDLIRFDELPGEYDVVINDNTSERTYTWKISENLSFFTLSSPNSQTYNFFFEAEATPKEEDVIVRIEVLIR